MPDKVTIITFRSMTDIVCKQTPFLSVLQQTQHLENNTKHMAIAEMPCGVVQFSNDVCRK